MESLSRLLEVFLVRRFDDLTQHGEIDIAEAFDVEAALPAGVLPEPRQLILQIFEAAHEIEREVRFARGEADWGPVTGVTTGIDVMHRAKPDDRAAPQHRRLARDLPHHAQDDLAVLPLALLRQRRDELLDGRRGWLGLQLAHGPILAEYRDGLYRGGLSFPE